MAQGKFITFEGGEGAGKSTQLKLLTARLEGAGIKVLETREPGGSPLAERIRQILLSHNEGPIGPLTEALLFYAARADHLEKVIRPALAAGTWVLSDRFSDSTNVYQGLSGAVSPIFLKSLEREVVGKSRPDLTVILDLPAEEGMRRAEIRRGLGPADRFEGRGLSFHEGLRDGFHKVAEDDPRRCVIVDALGTPNVVGLRVWRETATRLHIGAR
jgi:dTMP kinase